MTWFVKHCVKREFNINLKFSRINISLKNDVRELSIILYKAQSWFNEEMYKLQRRIPSIFETNSAKFLIAGPNFGKITSLHGYCLGILRVLVRALARLKTVSMRQIYSELCTHMTAITRAVFHLCENLSFILCSCSLDYKICFSGLKRINCRVFLCCILVWPFKSFNFNVSLYIVVWFYIYSIHIITQDV